ncbi:MAG: hypothetical protein GC185_10805 [Alphaproteobacteria bacterium]|nr:hypothetical protein [Alphaproteobacteria bacterium]
MKIFHHRVNDVHGLSSVPAGDGIETDVRYHENDLVLHHDPFRHHEPPVPDKLGDLLTAWENRGPVILNVKTEGVEQACIDLMNEYGVAEWFFLDLSMPYFVRYADKAASGVIGGFGPENLAVRFSEREPIEYALAFTGKAGWVWVDCFTDIPLDAETHARLKAAGFRICLVAPELQGHPPEMAARFRERLEGLDIDAVCTKRSDLWR